MITVLASVLAGGVAIGLLVGAVALLVVRVATPRSAEDLSIRRQTLFVKDARRDERDRREAA